MSLTAYTSQTPREHPPLGANLVATGRRLSVVVALILVATVSFGPGLARAAGVSWSTPITLDTAIGGYDSVALACPTASQCTAVSSVGQELTFDPSAPVGLTPKTIAPGAFLAAVACPSATQCTAVGDGGVVTFDPTAPGTPVPAVGLGNDDGAIACPSATQCTALSAAGATTFDPTAPGTPSPAAGVDDGAIACPSVNQCTVVSGSDEQTFDPTAPGTPTSNPIDSGSVLSAVTCPTTTQCTAIGTGDGTNETGAHAWTFDPTSPSVRADVSLDPGSVSVVACPSTSECAAVGNTGEETTFDPNSPGSPTAVLIDPSAAPVSIGNFGNHLRSVGCPASNECIAVDDGAKEFTFNPASLGTPTPTRLVAGAAFFGAACPSASQCTAVDDYGRAATFNPAAPGTPTPVALDSEDLEAVACPSQGQCTAVDDLAREVTFNPTSPGTPTPAPLDPDLGTGDDGGLRVLACPSPNQCTAVGEDSFDRVPEVTFDPTAPGTPTPANLPLSDSVSGIACPSTRQCTAVGPGGDETTFDPTTPGTPTATTIDHVDGLSAIACPSTSQCTAVDEQGGEVTFDPAAPGAATYATIANGSPLMDSSLLSVACPSVSRCVAGDSDGRVVAGDPADPASWSAAVVPGANALGSVACSSELACVAVDRVGYAFAATLPAVIAPSAPALVMVPTVTGTPAVGSTLSASAGSFSGSGPTYTYSWLRDGAPISGETASSYTVAAADAGHGLSVEATATNAEGAATGTSPTVDVPADVGPPPAPVLTAAPTITGTPAVGSTLTASTGSFSGAGLTYAYAWLRDGAPIAGAGTSSYTVAAADAGHALSVEVTATNAGGSASGTSTAVDVPAAQMTGPPPAGPTLTTAPTVSGTVGLGRSVGCSSLWSGTAPLSFAYQWLRDGGPIAGAAVATYTVAPADAGHVLSCRVTATNVAGSASATSATVSVPSVVVDAKKPANAKVSVSRAKVSGAGASVTVACSARCELVLTLSASATTRGGRLVAVSAAAGPSTHRRVLALGSTTVRLPAAQHRVVHVRLNATGRRLLVSRSRLPATLRIVSTNSEGSRHAVSSQKLTFRA